MAEYNCTSIMDKEKIMDDSQGRESPLLNSYLKDLIEKQDQKLLTAEDIRELDEKYPLTQPDKEKILMLSHRHILRADQYKMQERWDSAIVETERALLFTPLDSNIRMDLAELYLLRSRQYGYLEKDLNRSEEKIRETLTLEPGYPAARKMLKEMQNLKRMLNGTNQYKKIIPLVIVLFLIFGAVLYPRIRAFSFWNSTEEGDSQSSALPEETSWTSRELKVVTSSSLDEMISLDIRDAEMSRKNDAYAIALSGYAQSETGPLSKLILHISVGDILSPLLKKEIVLLDESSPELQTGETLSFSAYFQMTGYPADRDTLNITMGQLKKAEAADLADQWQELSPVWDVPRPDGINLYFSSRQHKILEGYDRLYLYEDIKMRNNSMADLSELRLTASWFDEEDVEIARREINFVPPGNPPVRQESIQSLRILLDLPKTASESLRSSALSIQRIKKEE